MRNYFPRFFEKAHVMLLLESLDDPELGRLL